MPKHIDVTGTAELEVEPELARVQLSVGALDETRAAALAETTRRAVLLDALLVEHAAEIAVRADGPYAVVPEYDYVDGARELSGFRGRRDTNLELYDWRRLIELFTAATEQADAAVAGPSFDVQPSSSSYDEVRRLAAEDAARRAEAYCDGLGIRLGHVVHAQEPDGGAIDGPPIGRARMMVASMAPDDLPEIGPGLVKLRAALTVRFALRKP